ncbi:hypothetical protein [Gehongia tenuis]|uniref:Uncharacterized protein n=1 Tax=Gehongia tenuis TaxID=2763655 RepID=A0A926D5C1_9FIRM|nr:hypothetical protein [Gehongia tenuis]MBC8531901.1 hypothetical protein [Gehongia tenuis]
MPDIFERMRDGIVRGASTVAEEGGKLVERGRIKASILKLEDEKRGKLQELGQMFYEMYKKDELHTEVLREVCMQVERLDEELETQRSNERLKSEE